MSPWCRRRLIQILALQKTDLLKLPSQCVRPITRLIQTSLTTTPQNQRGSSPNSPNSTSSHDVLTLCHPPAISGWLYHFPSNHESQAIGQNSLKWRYCTGTYIPISPTLPSLFLHHPTFVLNPLIQTSILHPKFCELASIQFSSWSSLVQLTLQLFYTHPFYLLPPTKTAKMHAQTTIVLLLAAFTASISGATIPIAARQDNNACGGAAVANAGNNNAGNNNGNNNNNAGNNNANAGAAAGGAAAGGAADFGTCTPTIDFQLGRPGRKATEGTFLPTDPVVAKGQQDALNPNIITNRVCDQLTNVCGANQAAKDKCKAAQATVAGLTTKDQTTADAFNSALGF